MAIDDNTSYELTGAQVKDLASKVKAKADSSSLATVATTGNYNDLTNQPTTPTVNDATLTIQQNGTSVGTFTANASSNATISLTDTTYSAMTGASSGAAGTSGLVPAPAAGDEAKVLSGAGTWVNQSGGGGSSSVTYYAASSSTQGFSTYYTYLYSDAARTIVVTPDTILSNFENGDTVLIEFESTGTGSSAYKMTLTATTMTLDGDNVYRMTVIELNEYNTTYNCVTAYLSATWDGQSSFNGRWTIVRNTKPVVNDGTLTIQQNGTTIGTFTANQSSASTVNIETIYADTVSPATAVDPITASMIAGGTSASTLANGALVEIVGTTTGDCNYALKYADGRLVCFQKVSITDRPVTQGWGSDYIAIVQANTFSDYAVEFTAEPVISVIFVALNENKNTAWVINTGGTTKTKMGQCYLVRPNSATVNGTIHVVAHGFWK